MGSSHQWLANDAGEGHAAGKRDCGDFRCQSLESLRVYGQQLATRCKHPACPAVTLHVDSLVTTDWERSALCAVVCAVCLFSMDVCMYEQIDRLYLKR